MAAVPVAATPTPPTIVAIFQFFLAFSQRAVSESICAISCFNSWISCSWYLISWTISVQKQGTLYIHNRQATIICVCVCVCVCSFLRLSYPCSFLCHVLYHILMEIKIIFLFW